MSNIAVELPFGEKTETHSRLWVMFHLNLLDPSQLIKDTNDDVLPKRKEDNEFDCDEFPEWVMLRDFMVNDEVEHDECVLQEYNFSKS
jgi:hypothetical protein